MKTKALTLIFISLMGLSAFAGDEIYLPTITKPDALQEGTQRTLTDAQIAELLPWAKDSKMFLKDLLDSTQGLGTQDKIERLDYGIKQVVGDSAPKHTELLMRYVLNRAIVIKETLEREMNVTTVGSQDTELRVLTASINMAIRYYEIDMNTLSKKSIPDFKVFGGEYFIFLSELNKSIFDASAQYAIQRTSLEWLQWDLYRDLNNTQHAPKIVKINNALKMAPNGKLSDAQCIKNIQQLKRVSLQLEILPANPVQVQTQTENRTFSSGVSVDTSKIYYYASRNQCYKKSAAGDVMLSDPINNSYCAKAGDYYYYTSRQQCYKKSFAGDVMLGDSVDSRYCENPGEYYYYASRNQCYKKSRAGDVMLSDAVDNSLCAKPGDYYYYASRQQCYKKSRAGDVMLGDAVNSSYCQ